MSTRASDYRHPMSPDFNDDMATNHRSEKHQIEPGESQYPDADIPAAKKRRIEAALSPRTKSAEESKQHSIASCEVKDVEIRTSDIPIAPGTASMHSLFEIPEPKNLPNSTPKSERVLGDCAIGVKQNYNDRDTQVEENPGQVPISTDASHTGTVHAQQVSSPQSVVSSPLSSLSEHTHIDASPTLPYWPNLQSPFQYQIETSTSPRSASPRSSPLPPKSASWASSQIHRAASVSLELSLGLQTSSSADKPLQYAGLLLPCSNAHTSGPSSTFQVSGWSTSLTGSDTAYDIPSTIKDSISPSEPCPNLPTPGPSTPPIEALNPVAGQLETKSCNSQKIHLEENRLCSARSEQYSSGPTLDTSQEQPLSPRPNSPLKFEKPLQDQPQIESPVARLRSTTRISVPNSSLQKEIPFINLPSEDTPEVIVAVEEVLAKKALNKKRLVKTRSTQAQVIEPQASKALKITVSATKYRAIKTQVVKNQAAKSQTSLNSAVASPPSKAPITVAKMVELQTEGFPRFEKGAVYIQTCPFDKKYSYQFHTTMLGLASPWFRTAMQGDFEEADQLLATTVRQKNRLSARFEFDFSIGPEIGGLRRASFTTVQLNKKLTDIENLELNKRTRAEVKQAEIIAHEEPKVGIAGYTTGQQEVLEAYNNLFLAYYHLKPNINQNDIQQAFRQTRLLFTIAEIYGSAHVVRPHLNSILTQFGLHLYQVVSHCPPQWLLLSLRLESAPIFKEAIIHIVGNHKHWRADTTDDLKFPSDLRALITRKISELKVLKVEIDTELFTSGICVDGKEIMLNKNDPSTFNTWIVATYWRDWYSRALIEASVAKKSCIDGLMYRQMARGGDAYLQLSSVLAMVKKLRGWESETSDEPGIEEDLTIMKIFARKKVQALCVNQSMLSVEEEGIKYFTCTKTENHELPWLTKDSL